MARPLRIEFDNAIYHVMNRGRDRQTIFQDSADNHAFLQSVAEAQERFSLGVIAYCLMGNHYHLLVCTPLGNLSRCMRHVNGLYTQRYNHRHETDGPLFRGRFKAILVDAESYLYQVSRYIHRNPIESTNPLVSRLSDYPWSSYPAYLGKQSSPIPLNRDLVMQGFPDKGAYRRFVDAGTDDETKAFYERRRMPSILGSEDFVKRMEPAMAGVLPEQSARLEVGPVEISTVISLVAAAFGCEQADLLTAKRGRGADNLPRWTAMYLCQERTGATLSEIAETFGVNHYSTVSQTIGRLKKELQSNRRLARQIKSLKIKMPGV